MEKFIILMWLCSATTSTPFNCKPIKTELNHIKKELCSIKDEQKKLSAYANMGKGGLKVVIWLGYIIAVTVGYFVGNKL